MTDVGPLLQHWRKARRLSQLALAAEAAVSIRHLCFVETGRANPSRTMVLRLAEVLDVPLRERNTLLLAAGFAPVYQESKLDAPALARRRRSPGPARAPGGDWRRHRRTSSADPSRGAGLPGRTGVARVA